MTYCILFSSSRVYTLAVSLSSLVSCSNLLPNKRPPALNGERSLDNNCVASFLNHFVEMLLKANQQRDNIPVELLCMLLDKASKYQSMTKHYSIDESDLAMLTKTLLANVDNIRHFIDINRCQSVPDKSGSLSPSPPSSMDVLLSSLENTAERRVSTSSHLMDASITDVGVASGSVNSNPFLRSPQNQSIVNAARYKTELCRQFEENGTCRYAEKCQFAHGRAEIRSLSRHPKYKTEMCRTFHTTGFCPYGLRCHFIHNEDECQLAISCQSGMQHVGSLADVCPTPSGHSTNGTERSSTTLSYPQHNVLDISSCRLQHGNFQYEPMSLFAPTTVTMPTAGNCHPISTPQQTVPCGIDLVAEYNQVVRRGRPILARSRSSSDEENSASEVHMNVSMTSSLASLKSVTEE